MAFWAGIWDEAVDDSSVFVVIAFLLSAVLVRAFASSERGRLKALFVLTCLHLVMLPLVGWLRAEGSRYYADLRLLAQVFETLAFVGVGSIVLFGVLVPRVGLRAPRILRDSVAAAAVLITLIVLAERAGFPITGLITGSAVVTAVLGFSMQDTLGNVMGGLALQLDNSIEVGDWVKVGDLRGQVSEIRWRYTAIETRNWETVIVPNSILMKGQVVIEGRRTGMPHQLRRWVWFNVDFRFQPSDVIEAVNAALQAAPIERVAATPEAHCVLMDLAESYGRYAVRYWLTDIRVDDGTDSTVRTRIYFALKRVNMPLSMPAHALFITERNNAHKQEKSQADRQARLDVMAHVDLFDGLDEATRAKLADRLHYAPFTRGETMTRQGAEGHWLYMMIDGEAVVRVAANGAEREVAKLHTGNFFGEMSLMTGARRAATVVAVTDVECYRLESAAFRDVIHERPEMAERVAELLAKRKLELSAVTSNLDAESKQRRLVAEKADLLGKIRDFFGLTTPAAS